MKLVTRSEWGAQHGRGDPVAVRPVPRVVIHHSYRPHLYSGLTLAEASRYVRQIEEYHATERGWAGIGYNWLIDQDGRVFEGRGWGFAGAHTAGLNSRSVGICFMVDGDAEEPSYSAWHAAERLIRQGLTLEEISPGYTLSGHRDHSSSDCPGELVYAEMGRLRGLSADPLTADPLTGALWPTPELAIPKPAPPRADTARLLLEPIEIPRAVPENVSGTWGIYTWAREVAENVAAEAADRSRHIRGAENLVDQALWRLQKVAAKRMHPLLLAILWPFVERAADRVFGGR